MRTKQSDNFGWQTHSPTWCQGQFNSTILDFAGVEIHTEMQGRSLRPLLQSESPMDWRKAFYYRYCEYPQPHRVLSHYGVRTERYKLVHYPTMNGWGLFDLQVDPREVRNFYNAPAYTGFVTELKALLTKLKAEVSDAG